MPSPSWTLSFVASGTTLDRPLPDATIAVDVGNSDPNDGIFDHHHRETNVDCAAELILQHRSEVRQRVGDTEHVRLIGHQSPDLDCLASLFLVWLLGTDPKRTTAPVFTDLTEYVGDADQGRLRPSSTLTLYSYALVLQEWLSNDDRARYPASEITDLFADLGIEIASPSLDLRAAVLSMKLLDELTRSDWHPADPLRQGQVSSRLRPLLDDTSTLVQQQLSRCDEDLQKLRENGEMGRMEVPDRDGTTTTLPYARIVDPEANPGILVKYIRAWAAHEHNQAVVTIVQHPNASRTVISVNPESGYTLKGLGLHLETLEQSARETQETELFRYQDEVEADGPHTDPLFSSSDPWYDGRGHNFTIVDAPREGSQLSVSRVFSEVVESKWVSYEIPETDEETGRTAKSS